MRKRPKFTKRHHETLARVIAQAYPIGHAPDYLLLSGFCSEFERDNPAFRRSPWLDLISRIRHGKT